MPKYNPNEFPSTIKAENEKNTMHKQEKFNFKKNYPTFKP
jgi:hypothetical protein